MTRQRSVLTETLVLTALCVLDAVSTLVMVRTGVAREANPLLVGSLAHSDAAFLALKGATFLVPIALLEILRPLRPKLIHHALRLSVLGYVAIYALGSIGLLLAR